MRVDAATLVTILGMALVTYAGRVAGIWLAGRFTFSARVRAWLNALPGAILVAMVAPIVVGGAAEAVAAAATALVAWRTKALLPALAAGIAVVWLLRQLM